ncbi:MAG: telomere binding protein [Vezdaea aestivalis]|nr:MAG: telomere binding protein [Vezdaea aestivalis]
MDGLLAIRTEKKDAEEPEPGITEVVKKQAHKQKSTSLPTTPSELASFLKSQPDHEAFYSVLEILTGNDTVLGSGFVRSSTPQAAQVVHALVAVSIPDFWTVLNEGHPDNKIRLIQCLTSVAGLGAILARLQALVSTFKRGDHQVLGLIQELLNVLSTILLSDDFLSHLLSNLELVPFGPRRKALENQTIATLCSGKLLSTCAEAETVVEKASPIGDGMLFCGFIGFQVAMQANENAKTAIAFPILSKLFVRALGLGYPSHLVDNFCTYVFGADLEQKEQWFAFHAVFDHLPIHHQTSVLSYILRMLSEKNFPALHLQTTRQSTNYSTPVSNSATFLGHVCRSNPSLWLYLENWLLGATFRPATGTIVTRRAVVALIATDYEKLLELANKSISNFGNFVYIKNAPIQQQEALAQVVLLSAGYLYRHNKADLVKLSRSTAHLSGVSDRLNAQDERARFLGLFVATAISNLSDDDGNRLNFGLKDVDGEKSRWYQDLVHVNDLVGQVDDPATLFRQQKFDDSSVLNSVQPSIRTTRSPKLSNTYSTSSMTSSQSRTSTFKPYPKPFSDPPDTSSDPTLIDRTPRPVPVYISGLLASLQETEDAAKFEIALRTAPLLISRKARFGTELSRDAYRLANTLIGLQDKWNAENFATLRQEAMISLLVSDPSVLGPVYAGALFNGDLSLAQQHSVLTAIGLGARNLSIMRGPDKDFPTETLPSHLHTLYFSPDIGEATFALVAHTVTPHILNNARHAPALEVEPGINAVATREHRSATPATMPNQLTKHVHAGFIDPLRTQFVENIDAVMASPALFTSFLHTLTLVLHFAPNPPSLAALSEQLSGLYTSLVGKCPHGIATRNVRDALAGAILSLLEANKGRVVDFLKDSWREVVLWNEWATEGIQESVLGPAGFGIMELTLQMRKNGLGWRMNGV